MFHLKSLPYLKSHWPGTTLLHCRLLQKRLSSNTAHIFSLTVRCVYLSLPTSLSYYFSPCFSQICFLPLSSSYPTSSTIISALLVILSYFFITWITMVFSSLMCPTPCLFVPGYLISNTLFYHLTLASHTHFTFHQKLHFHKICHKQLTLQCHPPSSRTLLLLAFVYNPLIFIIFSLSPVP